MSTANAIRLGAFELTEPVGRGGMGVVWRGVHGQHGTPVAVKVITDASALEDRYQAAFRNEVRAVAGLSHPGIVQVFDFGQVDAAAARDSGGRLQFGSPYLVMEWLETDPLDHPPSDFAALHGILQSILSALAHAHARGVIHRDLKPDNVLVDPATRRLKLTDFGLAHTVNREATADDALAGTAHTTAGTPEYMAPEQARARAREQGAWSDLYSLGCMAYALTTGRPPYERSSGIATLMAHMMEPVPALDAPRFAVPSGFEAWVHKMMAKSPQARYRRAADAAFALARCAESFEAPPTLDGVDVRIPHDISGDVTLDSDAAVLAELEEALAHQTVRMPPGSEPAPDGDGDPPPLPADWASPDDGVAATLPGVGLGLFGLRAVPFVGRHAERDLLWASLRRVDATRRAAVVALTGPSGCGKSRLAEWLAERAHEVGATFALHVRSAAVEDPGSGFGPVWRRQFRAYELSGADLRSHLNWELSRIGFSPSEARAHGDALACVIAPEQGDGPVHFASPREAYFTMARVIERLSHERCVLLWIDDAQWTRHGLDFVDFLLQRQAEAPCRLLVALTVRTESLSERPDEARRLAELMARPDVVHVEVGPLPPEDRPRLLRALLGLDSAVLRGLESRTAGNPLFAVQLIADWVQRGVLVSAPGGIRLRPGLEVDALPLPASLHEMWSERVRLFMSTRSADDATALELAALLGLQVDRAEWAAVCRLRGLGPGTEVRALMDALLDAGLAERLPDEPDRGFAFVHGMFREALESLAAEAGAGWLADHHRACAAMLRDRPGTLAAERRGRHALAAGAPAGPNGPTDPQALEEALEALDRAVAGRVATGDYDAAEELLRLVVEAARRAALPEDDARHGQARAWSATVAHLRGDRDLALKLSVENELDARRFGWTRVLAEAYRMIGTIALDRSQFTEAERRLPEAAQLALEVGDLRLAGQAHEKLGSVYVYVGRHDLAERTLTSARDEMLAAEDELGAGRASVALARLLKNLGRLDDALAFNAQAHMAFEKAGDRNGLAACANQRGELLRLRGALPEAELRYQQALEMWESIGAGNAIFARANLGLLLAEAARFAEARPQLLAARDRFRTMRLQAPLAIAGACLTPCAASLGDFAELDAYLDEAEPIIAKTGLADLDAARMLEHAGRLCAAAGERSRARRTLRLAAQQWRALKQPEHAAELEADADAP